MGSEETKMPRQEDILEYIGDTYPDAMLADGYNAAIIGISCGCDSGRVVYSIPKMVDICAEALAVDHDEALEWLEYNTFNAFVGEYTPIYVDEFVSADYIW